MRAKIEAKLLPLLGLRLLGETVPTNGATPMTEPPKPLVPAGAPASAAPGAPVRPQPVAAVRDGDAYLFYVSPNTGADRTAAVRLVYAVAGPGKSRVALVGPSLSVPLENVTWRVVIPPGYELEDYGGDLRLRIAWGGGAERLWRGTISLSEGSLSEPQPLGVEADEPGSMWLDGNPRSDHVTLVVQQRSPRGYDGVDVLVSAAPAA